MSAGITSLPWRRTGAQPRASAENHRQRISDASKDAAAGVSLPDGALQGVRFRIQHCLCMIRDPGGSQTELPLLLRHALLTIAAADQPAAKASWRSRRKRAYVYGHAALRKLTYALYAVIGVVFVVLAFGVFNLVRTDDQARSRSNKLMRLRVVVQFIAILLVVAIGFAAGAFRH